MSPYLCDFTRIEILKEMMIIVMVIDKCKTQRLTQQQTRLAFSLKTEPFFRILNGLIYTGKTQILSRLFK